jgi:hypothetical protein
MMKMMPKLNPIYVLIILIAVFIFLRNKVSELRKHLIVEDRNCLPSFLQLLLRLLIGKRAAKGKNNQKNDEVGKELLSVKVKDFKFYPLELKEFIKVCGFSESTLFHVLPHVLGQRVAISLISNGHFPFSLLGSLHLKSFFEVHDAPLLEEFVRTFASHEESTYSMQAKYWGLIPNPKKGTDIVVTLELTHNQTNKLVWKEVLIFYSTTKAPAVHEKAKEMYDYYNNLYDFTNLKEEEITNHGDVVSTGKETWIYAFLSGDVNPIHISGFLAKLFGQKGRIAHGAMILGKALTQLESLDTHVPLKFGISFKGPIPCNSTVEIRRVGQPPVAIPPAANKKTTEGDRNDDNTSNQDKQKSTEQEAEDKKKKKNKKQNSNENDSKTSAAGEQSSSSSKKNDRNFDLYVLNSSRPNICVRGLAI